MAISVRPKKKLPPPGLLDYAVAVGVDEKMIITEVSPGGKLAGKVHELNGKSMGDGLGLIAELAGVLGGGIHVRVFHGEHVLGDYVATIDGRILEADEDLVAVDFTELRSAPALLEVGSDQPVALSPMVEEVEAGAVTAPEDAQVGAVIEDDEQLSFPYEDVNEPGYEVVEDQPLPVVGVSDDTPAMGTRLLDELWQNQPLAPVEVEPVAPAAAPLENASQGNPVHRQATSGRWGRVAVGLLSVCLVGGSIWGASAFASYQQERLAVEAAQTQVQAAELSRHDAAVAAASEAGRVGELIYASSAGQVADEDTRTQLKQILDERPGVHAGIDELNTWVGQIFALTLGVEDSIGAYWQAKLGAAIDQAAEVLDDSAGRVNDPSHRDQLAEAIGGAKALQGEGASSDLVSDHIQVLADGITAVEKDVAAFNKAQAQAKEQTPKPSATPSPKPTSATKPAATKAPTQTKPAPAKTTQAPAPKPVQSKAPAPVKTTPAPKPAPTKAPVAPAGKVTALNVSSVSSGSSAPGVVKISAQVQTSGNAAVKVVATVGGKQVVLSGSGGAGTYVGTVSGVPAGKQSWQVSSGGLVATGSVTVY